MIQDNSLKKRYPLLLKQAITAFQQASMFEAFSSYYSLSHLQEKSEWEEIEDTHTPNLLLKFCHFFDALVFSFRIHDVYITGEALSSEITSQKEENLLPSWIEAEPCLKQIANLLQFASLAQKLHTDPEADPIKVLCNPWHDNIRQIAKEKPSLFSPDDHIPLFSLINFTSIKSTHQLPILSDFVSGWVIPMTLEVLPQLSQLVEHSKDASTVWVFDSITTLCYAFSNDTFARCLLQAPTNISHEILVAGKAFELKEGLFESFSHIKKWQLLPSWQLSPAPESFTQEVLENTIARQEDDLLITGSTLGKNLENFFQKLFFEKIHTGHPHFQNLQTCWQLFGTVFTRTAERRQTIGRIVSAASDFRDRIVLEINTILSLWNSYYHIDKSSSQHISCSGHPLSGIVQNDCLEKLARHIHNNCLLDSHEKPSQKKLPRVVYIVSHLNDKKHPPSILLQLFAQYYDKKQFDVALLTTEVDALNPGLYPCQQRVALHSLETASSTLALLKRSCIAYKIEDGSKDHYEKVLSLLNTLKKIDPDIVVFQESSPINQLLSYYIQLDTFFAASTALFESGDFPIQKGFDHWISALEDLAPSKKTQSMQLHSLPLHIDSRRQWKKGFPKKSAMGIPEKTRVATTISNCLRSRLTPEFCKAVSMILQRVPDLYYVPIGPYATNDGPALKELFDPEVQERVISAGQQENPSDLTRCMDLYLNEFPFGGYMGMIDAMASGLPVVTQYNPKGPVQSRFGGYFAGIENACKATEEYIERAVTLLNDPMQYYIASQRSYQEYETRSSPELYLKKLQSLFTLMIEQKTSQR